MRDKEGLWVGDAVGDMVGWVGDAVGDMVGCFVHGTGLEEAR